MINWLKKFIDKLAVANEEAFKGQKLDCCTMNKQTNHQATQHTNHQSKERN